MRRAIRYREGWAVLDGEPTRAADIELNARRNVAFARRHGAWYRAEPSPACLDATERQALAPAIELCGSILANDQASVRTPISRR